MHILVTRPLEDVGPLVEALRARGHQALVEPMLSIERRPDVRGPLPLDGVQALVVTSANGVRAFAELESRRDLPVLAVGDASAAAARAAGFATVQSAAGDVADLARLVRSRLDPKAGDLFHPAAGQLAGDLQGALEDAGFTLRRQALYEAHPATALSPEVRRALADGGLDAAVFFSPRTARTFVSLVEAAGLSATCARLSAICLSEAVAARLAPLAWARVLVAERPEQEALLARLDAAAAAPAAGGESMDTSTTAGRPEAGDPAAAEIIAAFGGIRPMANKLGVAVSTVQGWRERGSIPAPRHGQILDAAKSHGVHLDPAALAASDRGGEPSATPETIDVAAPRAAPERPAAARPTAARTSTDRPPPASAATIATATASARPTRSWVGAIALGAATLVVGAGLAVIGRDLWLPAAPPASLDAGAATAVADVRDRLATLESDLRAQAAKAAAPPPDTARLENELADVRGRLDALTRDVAAVAPDDAAIADVRGRLEAVQAAQTQMQTLSGRVEDLDTRVAALAGRLDEIASASAGSSAQTAREAALALAILQLRDAVRGSAPFAAELSLLQELARSPAVADGAAITAAIAPLVPYAASGVPALAQLKADFPALARTVVAEGSAAGSEDWLAGIKRRVSGLISVRPVGPVDGDSPAAVVSRAEALLAADDLAAALGELTGLHGAAAEAARPWRDAATARLAVRGALNDLGRGLIARLGAAGD